MTRSLQGDVTSFSSSQRGAQSSFLFLSGCHFFLSLKMFPVICRQQEHAGTKEPLINSFIGIMTLYCVAMENVSAIITYLNTSKEFIINVVLLQTGFVWSRPDRSGCVKEI